MSKSAAGTTRYTLDLDTGLHRRLRIKAAHEGRPVSEICRDLIEAYVQDGEAHEVASLRAAYAAGVQAERERIARVVQQDKPRVGLPTRPPPLPPAGTD